MSAADETEGGATSLRLKISTCSTQRSAAGTRRRATSGWRTQSLRDCGPQGRGPGDRREGRTCLKSHMVDGAKIKKPQRGRLSGSLVAFRAAVKRVALSFENIMTIAMNAPINPNKALWEKGDFTRIAATMRESGESLVRN